jgi:hypothetical protein
MNEDAGSGSGSARPAVRTRAVRALVEFTVIVVGVLVALAVDQWAEDRSERELERSYLARLIEDLERDTANYDAWHALLDEKEESLERVARFLRSPPTPASDPGAVLRDVANGTNFAWNVAPLAGRATFDDLRGAGSLGLIESGVVRSMLVRYYYSVEGAERRIEARSTDYPGISYALFRRPEAAAGPGAATSALELLPDTSVGHEELERAVARLRASQLGLHIEAEINRGRFIRAMLGSLREEATTVLSDVREYAGTR